MELFHSLTGLLSNRSIHETEIEDLARRDFFAGCAKTFLSEIDGAFHPGFVGRTIDRKPAQIQFEELLLSA